METFQYSKTHTYHLHCRFFIVTVTVVVGLAASPVVFSKKEAYSLLSVAVAMAPEEARSDESWPIGQVRTP